METITVKRGDTWTLQFIWERPDDTPLWTDVTGVSARLQARTSAGALRISASSEAGTMVVEADGVVDMIIPATVMAKVPIGLHVFDSEVTLAGGTVQSTETVELSVVEDITREDIARNV